MQVGTSGLMLNSGPQHAVASLLFAPLLRGVRPGAIALKALSILGLAALEQQRLFADWFFECCSLSELLEVIIADSQPSLEPGVQVPNEQPACSLELCLQCILATGLEHSSEAPAKELLARCRSSSSPGESTIKAVSSTGH